MASIPSSTDGAAGDEGGGDCGTGRGVGGEGGGATVQDIVVGRRSFQIGFSLEKPPSQGSSLSLSFPVVSYTSKLAGPVYSSGGEKKDECTKKEVESRVQGEEPGERGGREEGMQGSKSTSATGERGKGAESSAPVHHHVMRVTRARSRKSLVDNAAREREVSSDSSDSTLQQNHTHNEEEDSDATLSASSSNVDSVDMLGCVATSNGTPLGHGTGTKGARRVTRSSHVPRSKMGTRGRGRGRKGERGGMVGQAGRSLKNSQARRIVSKSKVQLGKLAPSLKLRGHRSLRRRGNFDSVQTSESSSSESDLSEMGARRTMRERRHHMKRNISSEEEYLPPSKRRCRQALSSIPEPAQDSSPCSSHSKWSSLATALGDIPEVDINPIALSATNIALLESDASTSKSSPSKTSMNGQATPTQRKSSTPQNTHSRQLKKPSVTTEAAKFHPHSSSEHGSPRGRAAGGKHASRAKVGRQESAHYKCLMSWEQDVARGSKARQGPVLYAIDKLPEKLSSDEPWIKKAKLIWTHWRHKVKDDDRKRYSDLAKENRIKDNRAKKLRKDAEEVAESRPASNSPSKTASEKRRNSALRKIATRQSSSKHVEETERDANNDSSSDDSNSCSSNAIETASFSSMEPSPKECSSNAAGSLAPKKQPASRASHRSPSKPASKRESVRKGSPRLTSKERSLERASKQSPLKSAFKEYSLKPDSKEAQSECASGERFSAPKQQSSKQPLLETASKRRSLRPSKRHSFELASETASRKRQASSAHSSNNAFQVSLLKSGHTSDANSTFAIVSKEEQSRPLSLVPNGKELFNCNYPVVSSLPSRASLSPVKQNVNSMNLPRSRSLSPSFIPPRPDDRAKNKSSCVPSLLPSKTPVSGDCSVENGSSSAVTKSRSLSPSFVPPQPGNLDKEFVPPQPGNLDKAFVSPQLGNLDKEFVSPQLGNLDKEESNTSSKHRISNFYKSMYHATQQKKDEPSSATPSLLTTEASNSWSLSPPAEIGSFMAAVKIPSPLLSQSPSNQDAMPASLSSFRTVSGPFVVGEKQVLQSRPSKKRKKESVASALALSGRTSESGGIHKNRFAALPGSKPSQQAGESLGLPPAGNMPVAGNIPLSGAGGVRRGNGKGNKLSRPPFSSSLRPNAAMQNPSSTGTTTQVKDYPTALVPSQDNAVGAASNSNSLFGQFHLNDASHNFHHGQPVGTNHASNPAPTSMQSSMASPAAKSKGLTKSSAPRRVVKKSQTKESLSTLLASRMPTDVSSFVIPQMPASLPSGMQDSFLSASLPGSSNTESMYSSFIGGSTISSASLVPNLPTSLLPASSGAHFNSLRGLHDSSAQSAFKPVPSVGENLSPTNGAISSLSAPREMHSSWSSGSTSLSLSSSSAILKSNGDPGHPNRSRSASTSSSGLSLSPSPTIGEDSSQLSAFRSKNRRNTVHHTGRAPQDHHPSASIPMFQPRASIAGSIGNDTSIPLFQPRPNMGGHGLSNTADGVLKASMGGSHSVTSATDKLPNGSNVSLFQPARKQENGHVCQSEEPAKLTSLAPHAPSFQPRVGRNVFHGKKISASPSMVTALAGMTSSASNSAAASFTSQSTSQPSPILSHANSQLVFSATTASSHSMAASAHSSAKNAHPNPPTASHFKHGPSASKPPFSNATSYQSSTQLKSSSNSLSFYSKCASHSEQSTTRPSPLSLSLQSILAPSKSLSQSFPSSSTPLPSNSSASLHSAFNMSSSSSSLAPSTQLSKPPFSKDSGGSFDARGLGKPSTPHESVNAGHSQFFIGPTSSSKNKVPADFRRNSTSSDYFSPSPNSQNRFNTPSFPSSAPIPMIADPPSKQCSEASEITLPSSPAMRLSDRKLIAEAPVRLRSTPTTPATPNFSTTPTYQNFCATPAPQHAAPVSENLPTPPAPQNLPAAPVPPHLSTTPQNSTAPVPQSFSGNSFGDQKKALAQLSTMTRWEIEQLYYYNAAILEEQKRLTRIIEKHLMKMEQKNNERSIFRKRTKMEVYRDFLKHLIEPDCVPNDEGVVRLVGQSKGGAAEDYSDVIVGGSPYHPIMNSKYDIYSKILRNTKS